MTDRSIIFSAPMVRALLAGTKTQTRRVCKEPWGTQEWVGGEWRPIPRYAPGDRLWVREAWMVRSEFDHLSPARIASEEGSKSAIGVWYAANDDEYVLIELGRLRSPIHMPRWASRLTLLVTEVRVQRLHDITFADARAEDCDPGYREEAPDCADPTCRGSHEGELWHYRAIWNSIHGPGAWDLNPWVAAITFTVHRQNIDAMEAA